MVIWQWFKIQLSENMFGLVDVCFDADIIVTIHKLKILLAWKKGTDAIYSATKWEVCPLLYQCQKNRDYSVEISFFFLKCMNQNKAVAEKLREKRQRKKNPL